MPKRRIKKEEKEPKSNAGLAIPAGLFLGMGLGFLAGSLVAGLFIGLGAGFLAFLILKIMGK